MNSTPDRRKFDRFAPTEYYFAAVRPDYKKLGKIVDISRKGLLFHYVCDPGDPYLEKGPLISLDIFSKRWNVFILEIPCRIIKEDYVPMDNDFITSVAMRYCRAAFLTLPRGMAAELDQIIHGPAQSLVSRQASYS